MGASARQASARTLERLDVGTVGACAAWPRGSRTGGDRDMIREPPRVAYSHTLHVGPWAFTLTVWGPTHKGRWLWQIERTSMLRGRAGQPTPWPVAWGEAGSEEDARRQVEEALVLYRADPTRA